MEIPKVKKKAKTRNRYNQVPHWPETSYGKVTKTQGNITHKTAKRSVITGLQGTDNRLALISGDGNMPPLWLDGDC